MSTIHTGPGTPRPLADIAREIRATWPKVSVRTEVPGFGPVEHPAAPYLFALERMGAVEDGFLADDGAGIILRFTGNATTWRGADARRLKAELKAHLIAPAHGSMR